LLARGGGQGALGSPLTPTLNLWRRHADDGRTGFSFDVRYKSVGIPFGRDRRLRIGLAAHNDGLATAHYRPNHRRPVKR
jgi:hypothetical protein